ncbi:MAG: glycosyltransferase family 2 protein [Thermodesulfobacteriota bacterium]|nr:glycosyltransferase family 2 protein [Thermodesulfobacteriota bacterium]
MNLTGPTLTIIIPAYNERETILDILDRVRAVNVDKEIIVVDDGSVDGTADLLRSASSRPETRVLFHERNQGKGAAIRTGLAKARGRYTIIQDADLEYDPQDYIRLLAPLLEGRARVVYGSRILGAGQIRSYNRYYWGGRFVSLVTNILYGSRLTDEPTCYKVFETWVLKDLNLTATGFEFCPEVTAKVIRAGLSILEVPISYQPRSFEQGKKIRPRDGLIAVWFLLKHRFSPRPVLNRKE